MSSCIFKVTPEELVFFHECLQSKVCIRIFHVLLEKGTLNVSVISRKARCNNYRCIENLKKLARLGIVQEEFFAGRHSFSLNKEDLTGLMRQAINFMEKSEG